MKNDINLLKRVNTKLEEIRPYLIADGGDVTVEEITDDMTIKVRLLGACGTCPFSVHTLKAGVEMALRQEIPELKEVIAVN